MTKSTGAKGHVLSGVQDKPVSRCPCGFEAHGRHNANEMKYS